jgi:anti-sigma factor RsiW
MVRENWHERLEAYLDDELDPAARCSFAAETAADPDLARELAERRAFREDARQAMHAEVPADLAGLATVPTAGRRSVLRRLALPLAAVLALAVLAPTLLRNLPGAAGPRSELTRAGQVVAVRYGEIPDAAVELEAGCYHLSLGSCP